MHRMGKLVRLAPADWRMLLMAAPLVVVVRLMLWLLPFRRVRQVVTATADRLLDRQAKRNRAAQIAPERIAWAVAVVSSYIPAASCLTRALAAEILLAWHGYESQLRIGVAKSEAGQLEAHAWLEHAGQTVIGGAISARYVPLSRGV
jgi:hypothetical protein